MNYQDALGLARHIMISARQSIEDAVGNPAIPQEYKNRIREQLLQEETIELSPAGVISEEDNPGAWLNDKDRNDWYYWPHLRTYLLDKKKWSLDQVRSLDDNSDKVLRSMSSPEVESFDKRGLVLGYVQSGKTANYTALIAKAADVGYRLVIVLAGMDNGLRRQTQIRLQKELTGYPGDSRANAVPYPEPGRRWHTFTTDDIEGDFRAKTASTASLQGTQPVLLIIKKNGHVLERVLDWLNKADSTTYRNLPILVIDDEADQASINIAPDNSQQPSSINRKIRRLLNIFSRCAYVAYTATPFANILIPADTQTDNHGSDLYPKDFIINLPRPKSYVGAEALFGRAAFTEVEADEGDRLNVIHTVPDQDMHDWQEDSVMLPETLSNALLDFVLAGAARAQRGDGNKPATMLVHVSHLTDDHSRMETAIRGKFGEIRDAWRYSKEKDIRDKFHRRWENEFKKVTKQIEPSKLVEFDSIEDYIGPFMEPVDIRVINSDKGDVADYENEPSLKVIAIGGNKLSRGLTLEGLLVSYFTRETKQFIYDTVMQMGRWFGYREGYVDLTRLYTTERLADTFIHLALVEHRLREDLTIYENKRITPRQLGMRILAHPSMSVTNPLKQKSAMPCNISYSGAIFQTFRFPLNSLKDLADAADKNLQTVKTFLANLGQDTKGSYNGYPMWSNCNPEKILNFLTSYNNTEHENELSDVCQYIRQKNGHGELRKWTVAIVQRKNFQEILGTVDWGIEKPLNQVTRTRVLKTVNSLNAITSASDELIGLSEELREQARKKAIGPDGMKKDKLARQAARAVRPPDEGLLLLYPISKQSSPSSGTSRSRAPLFEDPTNPLAKDLIGVAISFPVSPNDQSKEYIRGTSPGGGEQDYE